MDEREEQKAQEKGMALYPYLTCEGLRDVCVPDVCLVIVEG